MGKGSNLHRVWDSEIIESENITLKDCLLETKKISLESLRTFRIVNLVRWMEFSRALVKDCYPSAHKIDEAYTQEKVPIIKTQIAIAGMRLAAMLTIIAEHLPAATGQVKQAVNQPIEISIDSLSAHIGETVRVGGHVYSTKYLTGSNCSPTFINIGAPYPNSPLTLFIWQDVRSTFSYAPDTFLNGKDVCVTGKLQLYEGNPEKVIIGEKDIEIK